MMVDFALEGERKRGLPTRTQAIFEACLERFRPIMMTTLAALLRRAAAGDRRPAPGSELRRPLGITIVGGLLVSQVLTLYTTPVIYLLLDRLHRRLWGKSPAHREPGTAVQECGAGVQVVETSCPEAAPRVPGERSGQPGQEANRS